MKVFYLQLIISILFSLQQNLLDNINKDEKIKIEDIKNGINGLDFEDAVTNISNLFEQQIFHLTAKINNLINDTLNQQEQIINKAESEQLLYKDILSEINVLKQRYRRNMIFSYIIGSIILFTFFVFYCTDNLRRRKQRKYIGYKNPVQAANDNNQLDLE